MPEVYWGLHICALAEVNINYESLLPKNYTKIEA